MLKSCIQENVQDLKEPLKQLLEEKIQIFMTSV